MLENETYKVPFEKRNSCFKKDALLFEYMGTHRTQFDVITT